jgi:hypothetical membrane protein
MESLIERYGGFLGMAGSAIFVIATIIAIFSYGGFNPARDYLSYLGTAPASDKIFNGAVALSGVLGAIFAVSLWKQSPSGLPKSGAFMMASALLLMSTLSYFTADSLTSHVILAALTFFLAFIAMFLTGAGHMENNREVGVFSIAMAALILPLPLSGLNPIAEHLAILSIVLWTFVMGYRLSQKDIAEEYEWLWQDY